MQENVLSDPSLARQAGRFVWLAIDIDQDRNAPFVARHPLPGVPTFLIIDSATEKVLLTRSSGLDRAQFLALLDEGERVGRAAGEADRAFAEGQALDGEGKAKDAVAAYERALKVAPAAFPRHRATVEALALAREQSGDARGCVELAANETANGPRDAAWANLVTSGLECSLSLPNNEWQAVLVARGREAVKLDGLGGDDRSGAYEMLVDAAKDAAEKKALAVEWLAFLENEAARAPTAAARAVYDPHRLLAAIALGDPARAVPALQASERELPDDYNGAARLGIAYLEMGRYDDSLQACERALGKVYGPRRLRIEETRATAYRRKGDLASARRVLEEAVRAGEALPRSTRAESATAHLRKLIDELK
jgi:tetratricopeptide (TPR) repeat protein